MINGNGGYGNLQNNKQGGNGMFMMPNGEQMGAIPNMTTGFVNGQGLPDDDVLDMFLKDGLPEGEGFLGLPRASEGFRGRPRASESRQHLQQKTKASQDRRTRLTCMHIYPIESGARDG